MLKECVSWDILNSGELFSLLVEQGMYNLLIQHTFYRSVIKNGRQENGNN